MPDEASFNDAVLAHQQGRLEEAQNIYREVLQGQPDHPSALHLLGVIRHQQGDHAAGIELIGRAIELNPQSAVYRNNFGLPLHALSRFAEALASFRRALEIRPDYPQALANQGMALASLGRHVEAVASYQRALQFDSQNVDARTKLASLLENLGRNAEAIQLYEEGIRTGSCLEFHVNLGCLLLASGRLDSAIEHFQWAIAMDANCAAAHFNLASVCQETHKIEKARQHFARAAELQPDKRLWRLRMELCRPAVFENQQEIDEYCQRIGRVLEEWKAERPSPPAPLPSTGEGSNEAGATDGANVAGTLRVPSAGIDANLKGDLGLDQGRDGFGADGTGTVPATLADGTSTMQARCPVPATLGDILETGAIPGFALSYHGRDQRRLKEQFAALYEPHFREQPPPAGSGLRDRKRIGILVTRRHEGMFLQSMQGIIEQISNDRWEVAILASQCIIESLRGKLRCQNLRFVAFGDSLPKAIRQIRAVTCDLIYYWEVGSDAMNYFLPFARLAPVQCTGWGSTITSGVPTVDFFLSSELVERPSSQSQYTERLWKSRTLFRYQQRLPATPPAVPPDFGLPDDRHLYVCFQNPLKLHPDFDPLLAGILEADPRALVVLLGDRGGHVARLLKERFARRFIAPLPEAKGSVSFERTAQGIVPATLTGEGRNTPSPPAAERIVFLPPQPFSDYCRLIQLADVILDPPHYGAGSSCYDLFSFNLPVVTWPGELIVGRITQACYRKMVVEDLVVHSAGEYVRKAVQVATDREYRRYVTERIANNSDLLFNDLEIVREHERFFDEVLKVCKDVSPSL